ncbi:MAG: hypothetical protein LBI74_11090 [Synergistaceae bacterium]|nr:hypothetical protein [Synergistaceae bacterium]
MRRHNDSFLSGILKSLLVLEFAILAVLAFSAGSGAETQSIVNEVTPKHVEVPGTGASFVVPKDFSLSKQFDGFVANGRVVNVIVAVIKSPFQGVADGFTDSVLGGRGIKVHSRGEALINGSRALFIKALHLDGNNTWGKWIMLLENGDDTIVVNGVFTSGDANAATDVINVLKSVVMKKKASETALADTRYLVVSEDSRTIVTPDDSLESQRIISISAEPSIIIKKAGESSALSKDLSVVSRDIAERVGANEQRASLNPTAPPISGDARETSE